MLRPILGLFLTILLAWPPVAAAQDRTLFENAQIRTMFGEELISRGYIVTDGGRIAEVASGDFDGSFEGERVDAAGQTIMPGLADMHVHYYDDGMGVAYLANGITLVRNLTGSIYAARRDEAARNGRLMGPLVVTSGPIIDGGEGFERDFFVRARSPEEARGAVRSQARSGYGAVKLYEQLDAETYRAAAAEARENGLRIYTHVPQSLDVEDVLALGVDTIEHLDGYAQAMARDGFSTERKYAWAQWWANVDPGKFDALARQTVEATTWSVPTFAITYGRLRSNDPDAYFALPEARLLPLWAQSWRPSAQGYAADRAFFAPSLERKIAFVAALRRHGANMLIGTDGPNPFVTPGYAIHDELAAFVRAGYSNFEVLRIATVEAARFIGAKGRTGTLAVGSPADLVMLSSDPVGDLAVLREPAGVMVNGHWYDRAALDTGLERRAAAMDRARERRSSDPD